jgi:ABC-type multidrug transport system fused ATPase/permease subunit
MLELRRMAALLRPHGLALVCAAALAGVLSGCQAALVLLVRAVLDSLMQTESSLVAWHFGLAVVGLFAIQGSARIGRTWLTRRAALRAERDLRNRLFGHLLHCDPALLYEKGLGDCLSRISHDAGTVRTAVGAGVTLVQRPLSAIAIAAAAIVMAPKLALWALVGLPVVALVIYRTGWATRLHAGRHLESLAGLESRARDGLSGLRTIQAYGAHQQVQSGFERSNDKQLASALRATAYRISGPPLVEFAAASAIAVVVVVGAVEVRAGELEPAALVAFLVALGLLGEPLKGIAAANALWEEARAGLCRVFELLDLPAVAEDLFATSGPYTPVSLELTNVSLDRGRGPVLDGLNLSLEPGRIVVVQGASGAGKSTLLDLIAGFVEPSSGSVSWNGTEASCLSLVGRRSQLALVDQESWLGMGTVHDAISLARPDATREEVQDCAERAGLAMDGPFLSSLPGGLDGRVGDAGGLVSCGERQRISLARALLRDAPILLLDEPTANLDADNELSFLRTVSSIRHGRTILIVSHRPGPLDIADSSYRLEGGQLVALCPTRDVSAAETLRRATGSDAR